MVGESVAASTTRKNMGVSRRQKPIRHVARGSRDQRRRWNTERAEKARENLDAIGALFERHGMTEEELDRIICDVRKQMEAEGWPG